VALITQAHANSSLTTQTYPGEVQARFETPLAFRIPGQLRMRYAHLGEAVHKGQLLAELDPQDAQAQLNTAKAQLGAAHARLALANAVAQRNTAQAKEALISASENEQSQASAQVASADVQVASNQLELLQHQLQYTRLVAEQDGIITSEDAETGVVLGAGQKVFGLAWGKQRDVVIDVPESRIASIQLHARADIHLSSDPQQHWYAQVREMAQAAQPQARTYRVKLSLQEGSALPKIGMTVQVSFAGTSATSQVEIPATALFHDGASAAVWVLNPGDSRLQIRRVTVAAYGEHSVSLSAGLQAGESLLAQGVHTVNSGMVVTPSRVSDAEATP
jgi:RND family efflux transporter MFP subunit